MQILSTEVRKYKVSKLFSDTRFRDVTSTNNFQKFITLEEEGLCIEDGYFCHPTSKSTEDLASNSVNTQTFPVNLYLASPSSCLFTGLELMIDRSLIEPQSIQSKGNDFFHCSSCLMALGKKGTDHISLL